MSCHARREEEEEEEEEDIPEDLADLPPEVCLPRTWMRGVGGNEIENEIIIRITTPKIRLSSGNFEQLHRFLGIF